MLALLKPFAGVWFCADLFKLFGVVGDSGLLEVEEDFLSPFCSVGVDEEVGRCPFCTGEVVLTNDPLFKYEPGRSPNFGKAKEKSVAPLLYDRG